MSGSHAYDMSGDAEEEICGYISSIVKDCPQSASFRTKKNALEALRKIRKSLCLSRGVVPYELKKGGWGVAKDLEDAIMGIVEGLDEEALLALRPLF